MNDEDIGLNLELMRGFYILRVKLAK